MTGCDPRRSLCLFSFVSKLILPIVHHSFSHGLHLRAHGGDHICFIRVHLECRFAALAQLTFNSSSKINTLHSDGFDPRTNIPSPRRKCSSSALFSIDLVWYAHRGNLVVFPTLNFDPPRPPRIGSHAAAGIFDTSRRRGGPCEG
jgi:hypothetical protein